MKTKPLTQKEPTQRGFSGIYPSNSKQFPCEFSNFSIFSTKTDLDALAKPALSRESITCKGIDKLGEILNFVDFSTLNPPFLRQPTLLQCPLQ
jgi:hypothetical protein